MRWAILISVTFTLFGCDDAPQALEEQAQEQSIPEQQTNERFSLLCLGTHTTGFSIRPGETLLESYERLEAHEPKDVEMILIIDLRQQTVFESSFGTCPIRSLSTEEIVFSCPTDDEERYFTGNINRLSGSATVRQARSGEEKFESDYELKCERAKPRF